MFGFLSGIVFRYEMECIGGIIGIDENQHSHSYTYGGIRNVEYELEKLKIINLL